MPDMHVKSLGIGSGHKLTIIKRAPAKLLSMLDFVLRDQMAKSSVDAVVQKNPH
jgi:hypothetical protein